MTVGILGILIALGIAISGKVMEKGKRVKCLGQIKAIHGGLAAAYQENGEWPQLDFVEEGKQWDESEYYQFWAETLDKFGVARQTWVCPSDTNSLQRLKLHGESGEEFFGSYAVTSFAPGARTPLRMNQPWVIERGAYHKSVGGHIVMPDGSVSTQLNPFLGR